VKNVVSGNSSNIYHMEIQFNGRNNRTSTK